MPVIQVNGGYVELRARVEQGRCIIEVQDDGKGLDEADLLSMFEMFWRSSDVDASGAHSMGIGLALVRSVVQMHEGTVTAKSDGRRHGGVFTIDLPLPAEWDTAAEAGAQADDIEDVAWTLGTMLETAGHDVRVAGNGIEALALAAEFQPDVAIIDIAMPSGSKRAARIRIFPASQRTPRRSTLPPTGFGGAARKSRAGHRQPTDAASRDRGPHRVRPALRR